MAQRKSPPKRPARPSKPRSTGGGKASFGIHLSLFNGWFSGGSLVRTGGGGRGRGRRGGLFKRLTGLARRAAKELQGKPSAGAPAGGRSHGGDSAGFDRFRASRPDLFDEGQAADVVDDGQDDDEGQERRERPGQPGGPTTEAHCPACGHPPGGHSYSCQYRGYL